MGRSWTCGSPGTARRRSRRGSPCCPTARTATPSKITWLRRALGLTGPVVVLRARTDGLAAVWASGFRARDGQRTSVLGAAPGASEQHAVWLATPEQVAVLDRCEGRGDRYRLARLGTGAVHTDDGLRIEAPWCYLGLSAIRRPLLVGGRPVRCADLGQAAALRPRRRPGAGRRPVGHHRARRTGPRRVARRRVRLRNAAAGTAGVAAARRTHGRTPAAQPRWPGACATPAAATRPCCPTARTVHPGGSSRRDPAPVLLRRLDRYEGDEYRRIRVAATIDDGPRTACWTYVWTADDGGLTPGRPGLDSVIEVSQHETPVTVGAT